MKQDRDIKMTEENNSHKIPKYSDQLVKYPLGEGDYFMTIPTSKGIHAWGTVVGVHYDLECKDLVEFQNNVADLITNSKIKHLIQSVREEEIALRMRENGLEKYVEGDKK
jgi:hypothetical protein